MWRFGDDVEKGIHEVKRPAVMILLNGDNGVKLIEAFLLDSGADSPFIKFDLAQLLELNLSEKTEKVKTAGKDIDVFYNEN